MLGLPRLPRLFHLLFLLLNSPSHQNCKQISGDSSRLGGYIGVAPGAGSGTARGCAARSRSREGMALPASKGRTEEVGTLPMKADGMLLPAQEQLLCSSGTWHPRLAMEGARNRAERAALSCPASTAHAEGTSHGAARGRVLLSEPGSLHTVSSSRSAEQQVPQQHLGKCELGV